MAKASRDSGSRDLAMVKKEPATVAAVTVPSEAEMARLKPLQKEAIDLLCGGVTISETARIMGVARMTIYNWLRSDPVFASVYNQWLDEMEQTSRSRLSAMTEKAALAIERALENSDAKSALQLLKGLGLLKPTQQRAIYPEEIRRRWDLETKERKLQL